MQAHRSRRDDRRILEDAIALEELLAQRLTDLGVEHNLTWNAPEESSQVDLRVFSPSGNPDEDLEFRLTLGTKMPRRLKSFVVDSLATLDRGVRIYLEIHATFQHSWESIVERVAQTIRDIAHRWCDFGTERLVGVRVYASTRHVRMERIDLMRRARLPAPG